MIQTEITRILTRKSLGLTFVLSAAAMAFAQQKINVSGSIVDQQNNPVPYASVSFSNKANAAFNDAALTDESGFYTLELVPGNYDVTVEAIDFKRRTASKQISTAGNIGNISVEAESSTTLTPTQNIEGVVISAPASRPYRVELDKKVYDPSQDIISKGGNLQDVLSNVPSVSVETDGTVSMRGNTNVRFLINGKPSSMLGIDDGANAMQSIPADQIDRIEVITNPSSKFEASGTAGILNIILKKSRVMGFNGSVTGSVGYLPSTNLNTNLSWRRGNWIWFLNGGGGYNERKGTGNSTTRYFGASNAVTGVEKQENVNESENSFYNANAGFNVNLTDRTTFNLSGMIRKSDNISTGIVDYLDMDGNYNILSSTNRLSRGTGDNFSWQGDIGLDHKFNDEGHNLSGSLSYQESDNTSGSDVIEKENNFFKLQNLIDQNTINKTIIGKLDYELPVGEISKIEAGYRIDRNRNDYQYQVQESPDQINFAILPDFTSNTQYNETINAAYAQFKSKVDRLGYQLGLRTEMSDINVVFNDLAGVSSNINKNYTGLFPSVFLSYDLGEDTNNQLLLNYSRRISRPRSWFLVPFSSYNDNRNKFLGNPDLDPQYINSFELGYAYQKRKFTINPTLYYRQTEDEIRMIVLKDGPGSTTFITRPFNVGKEYQYGLDVNTNADLLPWWKIMGSIDLYGYTSEGSFYDPALMTEARDFGGSGFSTRVRLTNTFRIDKNMNFQLQGFFRGGEKTAASEVKPMYSLNFGANRTIWDGNGTIAFNVQDIFGTRGRDYVSYGDGFEREQFMQWMPRTFSLSLTYRFKQGDKVEQPRRKRDTNLEGGDDEMPPM